MNPTEQNEVFSSLERKNIEEILAERFDIEALSQMVEHLDYANQLSGKLTTEFNKIRGLIAQQNNSLELAQQEIRDLAMDVELLKRSMVSIGQIGVLERKKIEKNLIRELFPPDQSRLGAGITVRSEEEVPTQKVDCENRLHLCKAACCRIFNVPLTQKEVNEEIYDWNPRQPYTIQKTRVGCIHLKSGSCNCTIYETRPKTCLNYSCKNDKRIWDDFDNHILNPKLKQRLITLEVNTKSQEFREEDSRTPTNSGESHNLINGYSSQQIEELSNVSQTEINQSNTSASSPVPPPNFDELRKMLVPKPSKPFVPPDKK